ncbi:MAG: endonuclease/exonuclease/phosphatase family protein, partial [Candidatus Thiodiazotropha sp.]
MRTDSNSEVRTVCLNSSSSINSSSNDPNLVSINTSRRDVSDRTDSNIRTHSTSDLGTNNINTGSSPNNSTESSPNNSTDFSDIDSDYDGESLNSVSSENISISPSANSLDDSQSTINFSLKEKGGLKCFYTNCDSIANKWSELEALIYIHQPDIIGLTEAFSKRNESINMSEYEIDGFQQFCNQRFVEKGNRGTILFVRNDLEASLYSRMNDRSCKEACWCEVKINSNDKLLIGIVYRSPNSTDENNQKLNDMISALNNEPHSRKVVMGDFNYREINWDHWISNTSETHHSHEFIESVRDSFLHQFVDFHTRYRDKQNPSLLDLVFANDELLVENIEQFSPLGKSDHLIITFNIVCVVSQSNCSTMKYLYDKGDYLSMNTELSSVDWHNEFEGKCIEEKWNILKTKIHSTMDKYIPKNKCSNIKSSKGKPVWMTRQALKAVKRKHKSWNKYQRTKEHVHFQYFCRDRNIATRECRKARREF